VEAARDHAERLTKIYAERLDEPLDLERTHGLKN
jgi:hypothetical protein